MTPQFSIIAVWLIQDWLCYSASKQRKTHTCAMTNDYQRRLLIHIIVYAVSNHSNIVKEE